MNDDNRATSVKLASSIDPIFARTFEELRAHIDKRWTDLQRELLRAFSGYTESNNVRFCKLEADISNLDKSIDQRLGKLEGQMADVEGRLIDLQSMR